MFQSTRRVHTLIAGAAGLTLVLGVGVAVGAVPRPVATENAASVHSAAVVADTPADPGVADTPAVPATEPPTTEAPSTTVTTPPTTAAKAKAATTTTQADPAPAAAADPGPAAPAPAIPSGPTLAARVNPTTAQVQAAIAQIATKIPFFSVATDAQARQFGDAVCTAFDQGNSYAQVKTQVQQALSQLPLVTIKPADMDFAIRTAVQLFCPGYTSKLV